MKTDGSRAGKLSSSFAWPSLILAGALALAANVGLGQAPVSAPSVSAPSVSARPVSAHPVSAHELARRVDDHYNHLQSLKTAFQEEYQGLGMQRSESGTLLLRKPGRMRWEYASTQGKVFVLDGKYAWFYAPGDAQVQRIPASQLDDLRSPLRFLLGHTKLESELDGLTLKPGADGGFILAGKPKGQQQRIAKLELTVTAAGTITGILMQEVDGAETRFRFSNEETNAALPESAFRFTPPKGVPVVDALPPV